jgi:hypothetical protein
MGITLISIPFWWNKSLPSLAATIKNHRADLTEDLKEIGSPISTEMPLWIKQSSRYKPNAAQKYDEKISPIGWY